MRSPRAGVPTLLLALFSQVAPSASAGTVDEYQLKAALLYNFAKFVEWPETAFKAGDATIHVCVLRPDPFGSSLENVLRGKTVFGRPLAVTDIPDISQASKCHILFVSAASNKRIDKILKDIPPRGVLTVGETDGFAADGGMVNIRIEDGRPRLEVNTEAAIEAKLRISAKVLELSLVVKPKPRK